MAVNSELQIAITMGDPAGVGPETIAKAWLCENLHADRRLTVVGHPGILRQAVELIGASVEVCEVDRPGTLASSPAVLPCLAVGGSSAAKVEPASIDPRGGQVAYEAVVAATTMALAGDVDAIVTAPLHKTALAAAGHEYPGHTELLGHLCGVEDVAMMLYLPPGSEIQGRHGLGVVHVTLHTALRNVFDQLSTARIESRTRLLDNVFRRMGQAGPRLAVAALNPHAGENGLFGDEEKRWIAPAVSAAQEAGVDVEGPLAVDTLMMRAAAGEFDGVVAMYHDQGHIALKLLGMHSAVNVTLGLPIVRTSVAHGTAFDLAWRGLAEHRGMIAATETAAKLAKRKTPAQPAAS